MRKLILLPLIIFTTLISCQNDDDSLDESQIISRESISGFVQKGPFINGTTILMNELNSSLEQTGNIFTSSIENDTGLFELNNVELNSSFVEFSASGFYFNEVTGELSQSQLTLTSLSDIQERSSVNVNILTHLEKKRVENLIDEGKSFFEAKQQSRDELLSSFGMPLENNSDFEDFDLTQNTNQGSILLAISIILQVDRNVGQLTELLSRLQNDFSTDGVISNEDILNSLFVSTSNLNTQQIRSNVESRFSELNINSPVPNFEEQLFNFLSLQTFSITTTIEGEGTLEINPLSENYNYGTVIELTAIPSEGMIFDSWGGNLSGDEQTKEITIYSDLNITANFSLQPIFRIADNGITCVCENVKPGDKGMLNGEEFEAVDRQLLSDRIYENADLSKLCTSLITFMVGVFENKQINQDISNWDVSNVEDMTRMFAYSQFNKDISNWDVSNVENMLRMFGSSQFNQDIGDWNVSNVRNMNRMFRFSEFSQDISDWCVERIIREPSSFSLRSPLKGYNKPIWGTCPD